MLKSDQERMRVGQLAFARGHCEGARARESAGLGERILADLGEREERRGVAAERWATLDLRGGSDVAGEAARPTSPSPVVDATNTTRRSRGSRRTCGSGPQRRCGARTRLDARAPPI